MEPIEKILTDIKSKIHETAGHAFSAFGHFFSGQINEAKESTDKTKILFDNLIADIDNYLNTPAFQEPILSENKKEWTINGRIWSLHEKYPTCQLWNANYWCPDGDGIQLYIQPDKEGLNLSCFSGIPASEIFVDYIDFSVFWKKAKLDQVEKPSYELQCIMIADYLCRIFCEYKEVKK